MMDFGLGMDNNFRDGMNRADFGSLEMSNPNLPVATRDKSYLKVAVHWMKGVNEAEPDNPAIITRGMIKQSNIYLHFDLKGKFQGLFEN